MSHVKKTNFILFRNNIKHKLKIDLKIDGNSISQVVNITFLEVRINETLTWNDHIKTIYNTASRSLSKASVNLPKDVMFIYVLFAHSSIL